MDLRERTVYLRASTYHDLLNDATHLELIDRIDAMNRGPFEHFQNLHHRGRPKALTAQVLVDQLHSMVGAGLNQVARFKLWRASGSPVRSLEIFSGSHPYTGVFHTQLDMRFERDWFERNPEAATRRFVRWFREVAQLVQPFQAHAHDTDDNSAQNIDKPRLLKRGYGIDVEGPIDLASNPGRELSRGEFRYAVNWLTLLGPELLHDRLDPDAARSAPAAEVETLEIEQRRRRPGSVIADRIEPGVADEATAPPRWIMLRLYDSPLDPGALDKRDVQRAVRAHLGITAKAADERWGLGYWQKKG